MSLALDRKSVHFDTKSVAPAIGPTSDRVATFRRRKWLGSFRERGWILRDVVGYPLTDLLLSHLWSELWLSPEAWPNTKLSALMSSSRSGQWIPSP